MYMPINALAYFYIWVSTTMNSVELSQGYSQTICCTTVNSLITNEDYFSIDEIHNITDSLLKKQQ